MITAIMPKQTMRSRAGDGNVIFYQERQNLQVGIPLYSGTKTVQGSICLVYRDDAALGMEKGRDEGPALSAHPASQHRPSRCRDRIQPAHGGEVVTTLNKGEKLAVTGQPLGKGREGRTTVGQTRKGLRNACQGWPKEKFVSKKKTVKRNDG